MSKYKVGDHVTINDPADYSGTSYSGEAVIIYVITDAEFDPTDNFRYYICYLEDYISKPVPCFASELELLNSLSKYTIGVVEEGDISLLGKTTSAIDIDSLLDSFK